MAKLTKTQAELLAEAKEKGRVSVERFAGRGPQGGRVVGGMRRTDAALALVKAGLLEVVSHGSSRIARKGYTVAQFDVTMRLKAP
jgi:hypothetical protein